jgi:hypothetical protein
LALGPIVGYVEIVAPMKGEKIFWYIRGAGDNVLDLPAELRMFVTELVATNPSPAGILSPSGQVRIRHRPAVLPHPFDDFHLPVHGLAPLALEPTLTADRLQRLDNLTESGGSAFDKRQRLIYSAY